MANGERFPIDFDTLQKGSTVKQETITLVYGVGPESPRYALACLQMKQLVERALEERGVEAVCKIEDGMVKVLEDPEALVYCRQFAKTARRKVERSFLQAHKIDVNSPMMTHEEKRAAEKLMMDQSRLYAAQRAAVLEIRRIERENEPAELVEPGA